MQTEDQPVEILIREDAGFRRGNEDVTTVTKTVGELNQNFRAFLRSLQAIVNVEEARVGPFQLEEIEFNAEITVEGGFKLLGTGVGVSGTSGVTFVLKRSE